MVSVLICAAGSVFMYIHVVYACVRTYWGHMYACACWGHVLLVSPGGTELRQPHCCWTAGFGNPEHVHLQLMTFTTELHNCYNQPKARLTI